MSIHPLLPQKEDLNNSTILMDAGITASVCTEFASCLNIGVCLSVGKTGKWQFLKILNHKGFSVEMVRP